MQVPPFTLEKQLSEIGEELNKAVSRVIESGTYIGGNEVTSFENAFASYVGVQHVISCNSGTDALVLALRALDIGPGDEVITPSFSFFATAEAVSNVGATPVFVDVEEDSYLLNLDLVELAITPKTKAIIPVHLFGAPVNMDRLLEIAQSHNLKVIEDCAQAAGTTWKNKPVGSFGSIGCFSFFPTKNLGAAGDGGATTTNEKGLAKKIKELSIHGMPRRYLHTDLGYNSRLDAVQAALLKVKLPKLDEWIYRRKLIAERYEKELSGLINIKLPVFLNHKISNHSWNQYVIQVLDYKNENLDIDMHNQRDKFKYDLDKLGVKTIIYYPIPIHLQPAYEILSYKPGDFPKTEKLCNKVLSLPIYPELSSDEQKHVIESLFKLLG